MAHTTIFGTTVGTLASVLIATFENYSSPAIAAVIGATFSFFVSLYWKWLFSSDEEREKIKTAFKRILGRKE